MKKENIVKIVLNQKNVQNGGSPSVSRTTKDNKVMNIPNKNL
jgi:hypothetical protein